MQTRTVPRLKLIKCKFKETIHPQITPSAAAECWRLEMRRLFAIPAAACCRAQTAELAARNVLHPIRARDLCAGKNLSHFNYSGVSHASGCDGEVGDGVVESVGVYDDY